MKATGRFTQWMSVRRMGAAALLAYGLTLANIQPSNAADDSVVVSNAAGTATSEEATLTVDFPPRLLGAPDDQVTPAVAANDSLYLVVWSDRRADYDWDVFGARVTPGGVVLDPTGIPICRRAEMQYAPTVASDGRDFLVIWVDYRNAGVAGTNRTSADIYAARVTASGLVLDPAGIPVCRVPHEQFVPVVAFNGATYLAAWADARNSDSAAFDIYAARLSPAGAVLDPGGIPVSTAISGEFGPGVAALDADFFLGWANTWPAVRGVYGSRVTACGQVVMPGGMKLSPMFTDNRIAVAASSAGYLVSWSDAYGMPSAEANVYARRLSPAGELLSSTTVPMTISAASGSQCYPALAALGTDHLAAWMDARLGFTNVKIFATRITPGGVSTNPLVLGDTFFPSPHSAPAVASLNDQYFVVWSGPQQGGFGERDIHGARVTRNGRALDTTSFVVSAIGPAQAHIAWAPPADIVYGTPLGSEQLNATADVPGSFVYEPPGGRMLDAGTHTLSVTFTPEDAVLYAPATTTVQLTVRRASLHIQANNAVRPYGQPNPQFTAAYWSLADGDTPANLDTPVTLATPAIEASPPGSYPITASGASDANYDISFSEGTLTVLPVSPQTGAVDFSFDPTAAGQQPGLTRAEGSIYAIARQPDGKTIIGGGFNVVNGRAGNEIARLHPDGSTDLTFNPGRGADGTVFAVVLQPDGKVLIGGYFMNFDGRPRQSLARLNADGSLDTSFDARIEGSTWASVFVIKLQPDGKIVIAGEFYGLAGSPRPNLARLNPDGTLDSSFVPPEEVTPLGQVRALELQPDGKTLAGGFNAPMLLRLNGDGTVDPTFKASLTTSNQWGGITAIALEADGQVIVAGGFNAAGGLPRSHIARLNSDGSVDPGFNPPLPSAWVNALVVQPDQKILVAGDIDNSAGTRRRGLDRLNPDGSFDTAFHGDGLGLIRNARAVLVLPDGHLLTGGERNEYFTTPSPLLRLSPTGQRVPGFGPAFDSSDWVQLRHLLVQPDGRVLISGFFDKVNGVPRPGFARLLADGMLDSSFVPDTNLNANLPTFALQSDGKIILAGSVGWQSRVGATTVSHWGAARLHPDGSLDYSFNSGYAETGQGPVETVVIQPDGKILLGGLLTGFNGHPVPGLVRLNADGSEDTGFHPPPLPLSGGSGGGVTCLALQSDEKILVGGGFQSNNSPALNRLVRLHPDGSLDTSFHAAQVFGWSVAALAIQPDGKILVGSSGSGDAPLVRLHPDGSHDTSFSSPFDSYANIQTIAVEPNGKILAAAWVDQKLLRLNTDGSLDGAFQVRLAVGWASAYAVQIQPDGRVLLGGWFTSVNGLTMHGIARVFGDPAAPPTFVQRRIGQPEIQLLASPPLGTSVYAVEDQPPAGWWATNISHGGVFDVQTGKVKFGPFFDGQARTLSYEVLPATAAPGSYAFIGTSSADGVDTPIGGDQHYVIAGIHPADLNAPAWHVTVGEVTGYGAAWRRGENWPVPPVPIPIDYVTRAAMLWRGGECYEVDAAATNAPLWWVNCDSARNADFQPALSQASDLRVVQRQMAAAFVPGEPLVITVSVSPARTRAYAVEDQVPPGWAVTAISHSGEFDAVNGKVKWGPFFDATSRALSYQATPPLSASGVADFAGAGSFDGTSALIAGTRQLPEACRFIVQTAPSGQTQLTLSGRAGARFLLEASADLATWTPLFTLTNTQGRLEFTDPARSNFSQRFYRAKLLE